MRRRRNGSGLRSTLLVLAVLVVAAGLAVGGYAVTKSVHGHSDTAAGAAPTDSALVLATVAPTPSASSAPGAQPLPAAVAKALSGLVDAPALGARLRAEVLDALTGTELYGNSPAVGAAPASTAKLLTAAAVLSARGAQYRITTEALTDDAGTLFIKGAGDPTLSAAKTGSATLYPGAGRLSDLVTKLRAAQVSVARIVVDDSAFTGPTVSPKWAAEDVPSDYAAAITAFMADGGRAAPSAPIRSAEPDIAAGRELAALFGVPGAPVSRGVVPAGTRLVASVQSATMGELVDQMLPESDNVIAECLARQVAIAAKADASFTGTAAAVRATLTKLGVDPGAGLVDGSGLAASDRTTPAALAGVLRVIASAEHPELHGVVAALPVAAWSGTLASRFLPGTGSKGAGSVRAKTGTLTGISTLAGYVHDASGRLLVFALMADQVPAGATATAEADAALDRIAAQLATCGCR